MYAFQSVGSKVGERATRRGPAISRISRSPPGARFAAVLAAAALLLQPLQPIRAQGVDPASRFLVVDCLLPGQVRRLGRRMTFVSPRRATRTSAAECEIRGGEYVSYDRADYRTALAVWAPDAERGDARAQTYVGEIAEKGLGQPPDLALAAAWYAKAAAQGYAPALVNLGHLYEKGLGVPQDEAKARELFRQAARLPAAIAPLVRFEPAAGATTELAELRHKLAERENRVGALEKDNAVLTASASTRAEEAALLTARLHAEQARIASDRAALTQARAEIAAATAQRDQGAGRLAATQAAFEARIAALQNAIAEAQAAGASSHDVQTASADRVKTLEQALAEARAERDRARAEADGRAKALGERETALAAREKDVGGRETALKAQEARLATLRADGQQTASNDGPGIELIEPSINPTRGDRVVVLPLTTRVRTIVGRAWAPAGLMAVSVNGQKPTMVEDGMFQTELAVPARGTAVEIVAIDRRGRRAAMQFEMRYDTAQAASAVAEATRPDWSRIKVGAQHALLIGNANYKNLPVLKTPRNDVDAIGKLLSERYGFTVTILHDATRYEILSALNKLREELTDQDDLLIYYAGHGQVIPMENRDRGYWLPIDAEQQNTANWISTPDITDAVATMNVHKVLLIADSCYSGLLTRSSLERLDAGASPSAREDFLKTVAEQKSRNVLTSGGNVPVLDIGGGVNSIFAKAFLNALRDNHEPIQGQDLAKTIQQTVSYAAKELDFQQMPQYAPLQMAGHESGDYIFIPKS